MLPLRLFNNRLLRLGQLLSPPMQDGQRLSAEMESQFLEQLIELLRRERICDRLVQPPNDCLFAAAPARAQQCEFGSYVLPLAGRTEDDVLKAMHSHHRHVIRKAVRRGATVRMGREQLAAFYDNHAETMARSGLACSSREYFEQLYDQLSVNDNVICAVVYSPQDAVLGGLLAPVTRYAAYYLFGGSCDDVSVPGAIRLLHWEVIRELLRRGVRQYDFVGARLRDVEGTKLEFIQRFKARFGSELRRGVLWKMDLCKPKTRLYATLDFVRRASRGFPQPVYDIIDQEARSVRHATPVALAGRDPGDS